MARRNFVRAAALRAAVAMVVARAAMAQGAQPTERLQYVRVVGTDYQFQAPASVQEGVSVFHLLDHGSDVHQMTVIQLGPGHSVKDFFDATRAKGVPPAWAVTVGATPIIQKGTEAFLTLRLPRGQYVLACLIPASDGRSHTEKGMYQAFTVKARPVAVPAPAAKKP